MSTERYPDSAVNFYRKLEASSYFDKDYVETKRAELTKRVRKNERGNGFITLIADSLSTVLKILPDYKQYNILKVYAYNKTMVGADISYQMSKTQEKHAKSQILSHMLVDDRRAHSAKLNALLEGSKEPEKILQQIQECQNVAGFVFAQTYMENVKEEDLPQVAIRDMLPPLDLDWKRNFCGDSDGTYAVDDLYLCQTWRAVFVADSSSSRRGVGHNPFMVDLTQRAIANERFIDRMHFEQTHPEYEYTETMWFNGQPYVPEGYFWQENVTMFGEHEVTHGDEPDNVATTWRRPRNRSVEDLKGFWIEPDVVVNLLTKKQFGETFGPILPAGMCGIDFASGPIASIDWVGSVTIQTRERPNIQHLQPPASEAMPWVEDLAIPIRVRDIFNAIQQFIIDNPKPESDPEAEKAEVQE